MEFDLSTFVLEGINFLVLVWILSRFLYKPVIGAIERRKETVRQSLDEAKRLQSEAEALRIQYEGRLALWEQERHAALESLHQEIERERARQLAALKKTLEQEREKARVVDARHLQEARRRDERIVLDQGARFAALLLSRIAGPELEERIVELALEDLGTLASGTENAAAPGWGRKNHAIKIVSAYPLAAPQRDRLERALKNLLSGNPKFDYAEDKEIIAGLRISAGPRVMQANLRDELKNFAEFAHGRER